MRLRVWTPLAIAAAMVGAALAQGERGKVFKGWGVWVDPDGDCRARVDGKTLSIEVPGTLHDIGPELGKVNAPRVLTTLAGEFLAEVEVLGDLHPSGRCTRAGGVPYHGAGLLLWEDEDTNVRLERAAVLQPNGQVLPYVNFEARRDGRPVAGRPMALPNRDCHLRLERRSGQLLASVSFDGVRWTALDPFPDDLPETVRIGVDAINSSSEPFLAQLRGFVLFTPADVPTAAKP